MAAVRRRRGRAAPRAGHARFGLLVCALLLSSVLPAPPSGAAPQPLAVAGVDLAFDASGITLSDADPRTDTLVWVNGTVRNAGDTPADATALFYLGDEPGATPFDALDFTVGNESSAAVGAWLSTQDLLGYQTVTVRIAGIVPAENGTPADNEASARFRVHIPGEIDLSTAWDIHQRVNTTGFVTLRGAASVVVHGDGSLWVNQQRADQFEISLFDDASLHIDGGLVTSDLPITVVLRDRATLTVSHNGTLSASVSSTSTGTVAFIDGRMAGARLDVDGGSVLLTGSEVTLSGGALNGSSLTGRGSVVSLASTLEVSGPALVDFEGSAVRAATSFATVPQAEAAFPGITAALGPGHGRFFPAVHMAGASFASFTATVVEATVRVGATDVRSDIPIHAHLGARAEVYRIAAVDVTDPNGVPVANASVVVREASSNATVVASVVAANGSARVPLLTDIVAYNTSLPVGFYKLNVSRGAVVAPTINLSFPQVPDLAPGSLEARIPVALEIFEPWDIYDTYQDFITENPQTTQVWNTSFVFRSAGNFSAADVLLQQSRPFQLFLAFDTGSTMNMSGATIRSEYPFNLYLLNGTSAIVRGSSLLNANILMSGGGSLELTDSRLVGSLLGQAAGVTVTRSLVWAPRVDLDVGRLVSTDSVVASAALIDLGSGAADLTRTGLTGTYQPADPMTMPIPTWADFNGLAGSPVAEVDASPPIALRSGAINATALTAWTGGPFSMAATSSPARVSATRLVAAQATLGVYGGELLVEEVWVDPEATLSLVGDGVVRLRGLTSAPWTKAPDLTVHLYEPIVVEVVDGVGLPVEGAQVSASALLVGDANETAVTDSTGTATLFLHRSSATPAGPSPGATYRVSATRGNASSQETTWDPSSDDNIHLRMGAVFSQPSADALFAIIYRGTATHLVSSSLGPTGAIALLAACGIPAGPLTPPGTLYPLEEAQICISADLVYAQGGQTHREPMAAGSWSLEWNGTVIAEGTVNASGIASTSFALPPQAGNLTLNLTVTAPAVPQPLVLHPSMSISQPAKLVVTAFLLKAVLDQKEPIRLSGRVTFENGTPVAGAAVSLTTQGGVIPADVTADSRGSFYVQGLTGAVNGSFAVVLTVSASRASASDPQAFNYTVGSIAQPPTETEGPGGLGLVAVILSSVLFAGCGGVFYFAMIQRRVARGQYVECGNCGRPTYAADPKCRHCQVEFEPGLAKCSHCNAWISAETEACPQCGTAFTKAVERKAGEGREPGGAPAVAAKVEYAVPAGGAPASARRAGAGRLEELEFKLPGTAETLDLGEAGETPSFGGGPPGPRPARDSPAEETGFSPPPPWAQAPEKPVERMGLPRREDEESPVREIGGGGDSGGAAQEPLSFGTTRPDLASSAQPKPPGPPVPAGGEEVTPDMLREILRQAAPELTDELLPSDIRKELEEIARSEAPAAAERQRPGRSRGSTPTPPARPEDQTMEAPEKSRKSAFDVFSTPAKNVPPGFERRGAGGKADPKASAKGAAAPVCPNCGGNWVVQREGKNSCRVCGTRW